MWSVHSVFHVSRPFSLSLPSPFFSHVCSSCRRVGVRLIKHPRVVSLWRLVDLAKKEAKKKSKAKSKKKWDSDGEESSSSSSSSGSSSASSSTSSSAGRFASSCTVSCSLFNCVCRSLPQLLFSDDGDEDEEAEEEPKKVVSKKAWKVEEGMLGKRQKGEESQQAGAEAEAEEPPKKKRKRKRRKRRVRKRRRSQNQKQKQKQHKHKQKKSSRPRRRKRRNSPHPNLPDLRRWSRQRRVGHGCYPSACGMQPSRAWCGTPPILGVVNMVGSRNFTCYMGAL